MSTTQTPGRPMPLRTARRPLAILAATAILAALLSVIGANPAAAAPVDGVQGRISNQDGQSEQGVQVDLFSANGDGSRAAFLSNTDSDHNGWFHFSVSDGCYVVTMIAPNGRSFVGGSRWHQRNICVSNGQGTGPLNATLETMAAQCSAGELTWNLEFEDHFSGNGASLDQSWAVYNSTGNSGYGLRRPSALSLWNGNLNIKAGMEGGSLVSGGMQHSVAQTYGRYEFRVRTDQDWAEGTSGIVLTWPQSGVHPRDGENNIYETLWAPGDRHEFYTFIHEPYGTVHDQDYTVHQANASQWHTMVMEWAPDRLLIYRDGELIKTIWENDDDLIPDVPHQLTIQLDAWKQSIPNPVWMQVDYVKIWSYGGVTSC